ncbi:hypothetical protein [uncultured Flavobacterium sp.]|uniref:hypothetical protein n=1 Tax=uncultured Flavobacterium sp. TaxID=165435 RepID=UPI00261379B4|nr:hypothetical protein [uncultured Flavobacterium sp.]
MNFKAKIYIKDKSLPFYKKMDNSEQLQWISISFALILLLILSNTENNIENIFESILKNIIYVCLGLFLISVIMRFGEYEKLNGKLEGEISFEKDGIKINNQLFEFNQINDFNIEFSDKYGSQTGKSNGAFLSQGLKNSISFYHNGKLIITYFQLYSSEQLEAIKKDLFFIITNELIIFKKKYLNLVDKKYKNTTDYLFFIEKMKKESKLS